jgi:hypothetical protein
MQASVRNPWELTHCDKRPSWEIVSRILSAKLVHETWVGTPLTFPFADFEGAGKGSSRTSVEDDEAIVGLGVDLGDTVQDRPPRDVDVC